MSSEFDLREPQASRPRIGPSIRSLALPVLTGFVVAAVVGYFGSSLLPSRYTADASFYLMATSAFQPVQGETGDEARFVANQADLAVASVVLEDAGARLAEPLSLSEVQDSVTVTSSNETNRVTVRAQGRTPEQARDLANGVVDSYRELIAGQVAAKAAAATAALDTPDPLAAADPDVEAQQRDIALRAAVYGDGVGAVDTAQLPGQASSPRPTQNALILGLLGAFVAAGISALTHRHRRTDADFEQLLGIPLLGYFEGPKSSAVGPAVVGSVRDPLRDGVATAVLSAIDLSVDDRPRPSVAFLTINQGSAATSLVLHVALAAARRGRAVVVVDGGGKEHGISAVTRVPPGEGLERIASPSTPVAAALRTWHKDQQVINVVPTTVLGSRDPVVARPHLLRSALARLQEFSELTLVDGPPLSVGLEALAIARSVDSVVLILDSRTSDEDALRLRQGLATADIDIAGLVIIGRPSRGQRPSAVPTIGRRSRTRASGLATSHRSPAGPPRTAAVGPHGQRSDAPTSSPHDHLGQLAAGVRADLPT